MKSQPDIISAYFYMWVTAHAKSALTVEARFLGSILESMEMESMENTMFYCNAYNTFILNVLLKNVSYNCSLMIKSVFVI